MNTWKITDFGAVRDSLEVQTDRIQACINTCHANGGGQVVIDNGVYITGSLELFSNITLLLKTGAVLKGSKNLEDYTDFGHSTTVKYLYDEEYIRKWHLPPYYFHALISAENGENIAVIAEPGAVIDGQDVFDANGEEKFRGPMGMAFSQIRNLRLAGYTMQNSSNWSHVIDGCENVRLENVTIAAGHDGFNLHHSTHIEVTDCRFETGDDCLAGYDLQDLSVRHCYLNTACNGMRIGGKDLKFTDCIFAGPGHYPHLSEGTYYTHAVFKYYAVLPDVYRSEGDGILFENCMIKGADRFVLYDHDRTELMHDGTPLRSLTFENIMLADIAHTSVFKGGSEKSALTLKNMIIDYTAEEAFLEVDDAVVLTLENVFFVHPVKIRLNDSTVIELESTVNAVL